LLLVAVVVAHDLQVVVVQAVCYRGLASPLTPTQHTL
jgi:hypothetical protein